MAPSASAHDMVGGEIHTVDDQEWKPKPMLAVIGVAQTARTTAKAEVHDYYDWFEAAKLSQMEICRQNCRRDHCGGKGTPPLLHQPLALLVRQRGNSLRGRKTLRIARNHEQSATTVFKKSRGFSSCGCCVSSHIHPLRLLLEHGAGV